VVQLKEGDQKTHSHHGVMKKNAAAVSLGRKGGKARAKSLTPERRSEIALLAVQAREKKRKAHK
jgi:hypothetical protein